MAGKRSVGLIDYDDKDELDAIDWILSIFYAVKELQLTRSGLPSRVHVQKALFIASQYIPRLSEIVEFRPYRQGPWSEEVNDALEIVRDNGWVIQSRRGLLLSVKGRQIAEDSWNKLKNEEKEILKRIIGLVSRMTRDELLIYVYTLYGYSGKSEVLKELQRERKQLALNILRKNLVSVELAAKIAGMTLPQFIKYLKKHGYKPYTVEADDIDKASKL